MKKLVLFFLLIVCLKCEAQNDSLFKARDLSISWEPVQNNYKTADHSLNAITITNTGKKALPASGWKLFFNSARLLDSASVSKNMKISFINGDLFSMTPASTFSEIAPGTSMRIEYVANEPVINITDAPEGFYLVWDSQPERGFNVGNVTVKNFNASYTGMVTSSTIYDQNKNIKNVPEEQVVKVFPTPVSYKPSAGSFDLNRFVLLSSISIDKTYEKEANNLRNYLTNLIGYRSEVNAKALATKSVKILYKDTLSREGYELSVTPTAITIRASTTTGVFYGIQTLKSLITPFPYTGQLRELKIPCVEVRDEPRFAYRAFMLDVARNFQTKTELLRILDVMALYKLNVLHLHLTDDEGWRLEIPGLPELTKIGAHRGHSLDSRFSLAASHGSGGEIDTRPNSGFYSRADFVEILKYADHLHIQVIPEIEAPGHARAAIKSMNARYNLLNLEGKKEEAEQFLLIDPNDKSVYSSAQNWNDNVMDVSMPSTLNFVETIINNIVNMYRDADVPITTINWGGDEVPAHVWEKSPSYLTLKATHPEIQSTSDLWYYFYTNVNLMLKARGLYLSGWEEMALRKTKLDGKPFYLPNPDLVSDHVQAEVWNNTLGDGNEDLAYKLANAGFKVVLTNVTNLYFDMAYYKAYEEPGYYWGAFLDIDKPYSFIPFDYYKNSTVDKNGQPINPAIFNGKQRLTDYGKTNIIGLQSALWGENIKSNARLEYMLLPRLLAFAERAWSKDPEWATEPNPVKSDSLYKQSFNLFANLLGKRELPRLNSFNGGYTFRVPKPGVAILDGKIYANIQFPGLTIRYTSNGEMPDNASALYTGPIPNYGPTLKFRAFDNLGRGSSVSESPHQ